jgi:ribonuclease HII
MVANSLEEKGLAALGYSNIAGVDESGMGCFAGDVYVAAVIFPPEINFKKLLPGLNDSKTKTPEQRRALYKQIKEHALAYSVATASVEEIDRLNIYWARFLAARRALDSLKVVPDYVIIDGNKEIPDIHIPQHAIVKGDQKSISIAAASILAKTDRDDYMDEISKLVHPDHGWDSNRSYYCKQTIDAIKKHGKNKWHRQKYVAKYLSGA